MINSWNPGERSQSSFGFINSPITIPTDLATVALFCWREAQHSTISLLHQSPASTLHHLEPEANSPVLWCLLSDGKPWAPSCSLCCRSFQSFNKFSQFHLWPFSSATTVLHHKRGDIIMVQSICSEFLFPYLWIWVSSLAWTVNLAHLRWEHSVWRIA